MDSFHLNPLVGIFLHLASMLRNFNIYKKVLNLHEIIIATK